MGACDGGGVGLVRQRRASCFNRVAQIGTISYAEGGWRAPWGIEFRIDLLNAFVLLLVTAIGAIVLTASPRSLDQEIRRGAPPQFYALYLLCLTGLLGITITGDAFNLFVFLEISSLSSYALIALGTTRRALTASFQYLVMGTIGGTFILIGIGLMYMMTGTLNIADMAVRLAAVGPNRTVLVALASLHRHRHQARGLPAARLAAQRLHLRAVDGHRLPRRHRDQGRRTTSCCASSSRSSAHRSPSAVLRLDAVLHAAGHGGDLRRLDRRHLPERHQAHAGLLERRPDRLHGARSQPGRR